MKTRTAAILALAGSLLAFNANAALSRSGPKCTSYNTVSTMNALDCSGAWGGDDVNQQSDVFAQLNLDFTDFTGTGGIWEYLGTTNAGETSGPFASVPAAASGTLTFDTPITGFFAVALKGGNSFSFYLFDGGVAGLSSVNFSMGGTALNAEEQQQNLSHASLYQFDTPTPPVPEANTYLMMLAGLGAVGAMVRRRKH